MKKRLEALKKDQKGFTLVELIVVLVILAILAALLVPALLGYIDRAREAKFFEEARSIYTALQVIEDERYAAGNAQIAIGSGGDIGSGSPSTTTAYELTSAEKDEVNKLIDPTELKKITDITHTNETGSREKHTIKTLTIEFVSQDGKTTKIGTMSGDSTWTMTDPAPATTP